MVSFISLAFVVVKLQIFKCFRGDAASMIWPFLGGFWALVKIKRLSGNGTYPKLMVLVHFLGPIYPQKTQNIA